MSALDADSPNTGDGDVYRERLWPTPTIFVVAALVMPASLAVFLPISVVAGIVTAVVLYSGCVVLLVIGSPTIRVVDGELRAGRARLPLRFAGDAAAYRASAATEQRGRLLDARAWLVIRGWIDPVVKIAVTDPDDPTPYWLVSSRHPDALVRAISSGERQN